MREQILKLGVPVDYGVRNGVAQLLREADIPVQIPESEVNTTSVWFNKDNNALRRVSDQRVARLDLVLQEEPVIAAQVLEGRLDLGLVEKPSAEQFGLNGLEIATLRVFDPSTGDRTDLGLYSTSPVSPEVRTAERLRGISGFNDRLLARILIVERSLDEEEALRWQSTVRSIERGDPQWFGLIRMGITPTAGPSPRAKA